MSSGAPTIGGLKRLSQFLAGQMANAVNITGGTISDVTLSNVILSLDSSRRGTFTCNGATPVAVSNANITADSQVLITLKTPDGTVGTSAPNVRTITAGGGFTVAGIASDTSVYNYAIIG